RTEPEAQQFAMMAREQINEQALKTKLQQHRADINESEANIERLKRKKDELKKSINKQASKTIKDKANSRKVYITPKNYLIEKRDHYGLDEDLKTVAQLTEPVIEAMINDPDSKGLKELKRIQAEIDKTQVEIDEESVRLEE